MKNAKMSDDAAAILRSKTFASVGLVDEDGAPHVSLVWTDLDDQGRIVINTAEGRKKAKLMHEGTAVRINAPDPENPYRYVDVRGRVVERTTEGADDVIDRLAKKYLGVDSYPYRRADEQRVTMMIEPDSVRLA